MRKTVKYKFKSNDAKLSFETLVWYMAFWQDNQYSELDKLNLAPSSGLFEREVEIIIEAGKFEIEKIKPLYFPRHIIDTFFEVVED